MKPLELTIYPPRAQEPLPSDPDWQGWDSWRHWNHIEQLDAHQRMMKRLTDAELAAERWHAQSEYLQEATLATTTSLALPRIGALMEMQAVAATLLRFATTPHYFEEAA